MKYFVSGFFKKTSFEMNLIFLPFGTLTKKKKKKKRRANIMNFGG